MGNNPSNLKNQKDKNLSEVINFIASNYILTQNFQDLINLKDPNYCNKLVILTSNIIGEYLSDLDITYLAQKIKNGVEINELTNDKILFVPKEDFEKLDIRTGTQKKRMCIGIAKYFIKIAHLFSAIITTINPIYSYSNQGIPVKVNFEKKNTIPKGVAVNISKLNICSNRINALINNRDFKNESGEIKVKPKFCDFNLNKNKSEKAKEKITKNLNEEPGIPELSMLYFDIYDYDSGKFYKMSNDMEKQYISDLKLFYSAFTGIKDMPNSIKKFSDIKLRDFHNDPGCQGTPNNQYLKEYVGSASQKIFQDYASHISSMINTANQNQNKLIGILDKIFAFSLNPQSNKKEITINPKLTEQSLGDISNEARELIVNLYIKCEEDFIKGLEIFEAIVQTKIMDSTKKQIDNLEKTIEKVHSQTIGGPSMSPLANPSFVPPTFPN